MSAFQAQWPSSHRFAAHHEWLCLSFMVVCLSLMVDAADTSLKCAEVVEPLHVSTNL
jgi:hypothetical protein